MQRQSETIIQGIKEYFSFSNLYFII